MKLSRTLLVAMAVATAVGPPAALAQSSGHGFHPPMPGQEYVLQCRVGEGSGASVVEAALKIPSLTTPCDLDQAVELPAPLAPIRVKRYLPQAVQEQKAMPDESPDARPAIRISVDGPTQAYQRWLLADDPERNRLLSLIATWRYMRAADTKQRDELFEQFKTELTRPPRLIVARPDGSGAREVTAEAGAMHTLDELGCNIRVESFFSDYAMDNKTKQPVNQSPKRLNPAALVEIEQEGKKERRWVFAKFPDFKAGKGEGLPYRITLDCPQEKENPTPDFALVTVGRSDNQAWIRHEGRTTSRPATPDERIEIAGAQYTFRVMQFEPAARLVEEYRPTEQKAAVTALQCEWVDGSGARVPVWLELNTPRVVPLAKGPVVLTFAPRQAAPAGGHK
jgi:hypothetical protein